METSIMNYFKKLATILFKEKEILELVLKVENEKYDILRFVDVKGLMDLNSQEEGFLELLSSIEKRRKDIIISMCKEKGINPDLSLKEIIEHFSGQIDEDIKNEITELRESIKQISEKLRSIVRENEQLIKSNMEIISLTLNFANKHSSYETYNFRNKGEAASRVHLINSLA
ncbi:MAG: flagellar protein FlgN [Brevinematales bacterium]|nr:flagellar protein FlgN [Brevinematales bacterium]